MYDSHYEWSQKAREWVEALAAGPADRVSPGGTHGVLHYAATLAAVGHDGLAGTVLRAWSGAMSRRTTADATCPPLRSASVLRSGCVVLCVVRLPATWPPGPGRRRRIV